jgi:hypothetical protein
MLLTLLLGALRAVWQRDVASKVWVAARALLVGFSGVSDGFSCALSCSCGVRATVECPCGNDMTENRWLLEHSVGASPAYFSFRARCQSRSCLSFACVANVVVFHDDIGEVNGFCSVPH